jgi:hypothetical protein
MTQAWIGMNYKWVMIGLFVALLAACQLGYWLGRRARVPKDATEKTHAGIWQGAMLALSGLLIGFTFSMAQARYDARKQIVLGEANDIGTAYLRTRLLDDAAGEPLRALLRRYVDTRLAFAEAGADRPLTLKLLHQTGVLADEIWAKVAAAGRADPTPITALLVQSTNEMIDAGEEHLAAIANPLPATVFFVLFLVTAVAMASTGFVCALEARRSLLGMLVMPLLLATVVSLIFDLAHPRIGIMRVHDPILQRLKQSFE